MCLEVGQKTFDRPHGVIRLVRFFIGPALCKLGGGNMHSILTSTDYGRPERK